MPCLLHVPGRRDEADGGDQIGVERGVAIGARIELEAAGFPGGGEAVGADHRVAGIGVADVGCSIADLRGPEQRADRQEDDERKRV